MSHFVFPRRTDCHFSEKHPHKPGVGEVGRLLVSPEHQRKGVGERLMTVVGDHARANGLRRLELVTSPFNKAALRMYTKRGWGRCGELPYGGSKLPCFGKDLDKD